MTCSNCSQFSPREVMGISIGGIDSSPRYISVLGGGQIGRRYAAMRPPKVRFPATGCDELLHSPFFLFFFFFFFEKSAIFRFLSLRIRYPRTVKRGVGISREMENWKTTYARSPPEMKVVRFVPHKS